MNGEIIVPVRTTCPQLSSKLAIPEIDGSMLCTTDTFDGLILNRCIDTGRLQLSWSRASKVKEKPFYIDFNSQALQLRGHNQKFSISQ